MRRGTRSFRFVPLAVLCGALLGPLPAPLTAQQTRIVAFGDSITQGGPEFDELGEGGYPRRLQRLLRDAGEMVEVQNRGISGETTAGGLGRIGSVIGGADQVLIMEGANDIDNNLSLETTAFNLQQMVQRAKGAGVEPILLTSIPRGPGASRDASNLVTRGMAQMTRDLAFRAEVQLADPFEVFAVTPNLFNSFYSRPASDPVGHPNAAGFDLLAGIVADVLLGVDSVSPVFGFPKPTDFTPQVAADQPVDVVIYDFGAGIDRSQTALLINGVIVDSTAAGTSERARLTFNDGLCGRTRIVVETTDLNDPPNAVIRQIANVEAFGARTIRVDVDRNCRVDGFDIIAFAPAFGSVASDRRYNPAFDFDDDGDIDGDDLARIAARFGDRTG